MAERLDELAGSNALLAIALTELRAYRITIAIADALVGVGVTDAELSEFLDLAARDVPPDGVYSLALALPRYIDRRGAGHEALDYCLTQGNLSDDAISSVAAYMAYVTDADAVVWCHKRLTTVIRRDIAYCGFLGKHISTVVERCRDDMTAYLLYPDRGPANDNIFSFELAVRAVDDPAPFFGRWGEWLWNGLLDPHDSVRMCPARSQYQLLRRRWDEPLFLPLRETTHDYVINLLKSLDSGRRATGARHLALMVDVDYPGAGELVDRIHTSESHLLRSALTAAAEAKAAPNNRALRERAVTLQDELRSAGES